MAVHRPCSDTPARSDHHAIARPVHRALTASGQRRRCVRNGLFARLTGPVKLGSAIRRFVISTGVRWAAPPSHLSRHDAVGASKVGRADRFEHDAGWRSEQIRHALSDGEIGHTRLGNLTFAPLDGGQPPVAT